MTSAPRKAEPIATDAASLEAALRRLFGFERFQPGQEEIVRRVLPGRGSYAAGKAALLAAAQVLAREVGEDGIRVNTIVPGRMWGPNLQRWYETRAAERGVTVEEELAPVRELIALGDIPSDADVAGAVLFLASDLSIAMTGQTVDVNGGETFN